MNTIKLQKPELPPLEKKSTTYKMIIPRDVEEKIRYLLRKYPKTEWSGVLFITHEGSFENNDLVITCKDVYPMDLGDATYTQFTMSEDVASYVANNIDLFDCDMALVHSHHCMSTTPSGTDLNTLREEGNERNCFVSLIVNNAGTYYAAITRKLQVKTKIKVESIGTSYEFFGDGNKEINANTTENTKIITKEYIQYFDLEIERHEVENTLAYLDDRFDEILRKKREPTIVNTAIPNNIPTVIGEETSFFNFLHANINPEKKIYSRSTEEWTPNPKKIHDAVCKMLLCNLNFDTSKINLPKWIELHMVNVYNKLFGRYNKQEDNVCAFTEWRDFIVQYTIDYFDYSDVPEDLYDEDWDYVTHVVTEAIIEEIYKYSDSNDYIKSYIETLEAYLYN